MTEIDPNKFVCVHIFYNGPDLRPLIVNCVYPLVERLRREGLVDHFFFIRYWEGGPHVRLRTLPLPGVPKNAVSDVIDTEVGSYLEKNPSMFDLEPNMTADVMRVLYEFEYGKQSYLDRYGPEGRIPLEENSNFRYFDYAPEYVRYGGPVGIAIAHDIFQESSEIVFDVLRNDNSRHWDRIVGVGFQFMLHFAYTVYGNSTKLVDFFRFFAARIGDLHLPPSMETQLESYFSQRASRISRYVGQVGELNTKVEMAENGPLSRLVRLAHMAHGRVTDTFAAGQLVFEQPEVSGDDALRNLLVNYIHMTNNRLGIRSFEELSISKLIVRSLTGEV